MKFINVFIIIFLMVAFGNTSCNTGCNAEAIQHKEVVDGIHRYIVGLDRDSDNNHRVFIPGKSNYQIANERLQQEREAERAKLPQVRSSASNTGSKENPYPYGWCTWFVAEKKGIKERYGNAINWPVNSQTPQEGAIAVTYEGWGYGHVAYVKSVSGTKITLEEMNYRGWGNVSERTVDYRSLPLKGFLII